MASSGKALTDWVLESLEEHPGELPSFPVVAGRLVGVLEHPDADLGEVESLIHQDQAIASQIIRAANSPRYRGRSPIDRLNVAIMRLGFRETANVALAAACRSLYDIEERAEYEVFAELWQPLWFESLMCAFGARLVSSKLKVGDDERVFLGAMFRDVGSPLVLKTVAKGLVCGRLDVRPSSAELGVALATLHAPVGAAYLEQTGMPEHVARIAREHHADELPLEPGTLEQHVIRLAGGLCEEIGVAPLCTGGMGPAGAQSLAALELGAEQRESFLEDFQTLESQTRELF